MGRGYHVVSQFCYLGLTFSFNGLWNMAHKTIAQQACKAIFALKKILYKYKSVEVSIYMKIFDCKILPILIYTDLVKSNSMSLIITLL